MRPLLIASHSGGPTNWVTKQSFLIENMLEFYGIPYDFFEIGHETLDQQLLDQYSGVILEGNALHCCATEAEHALIAANMESGAIAVLLGAIDGEYTDLNSTVYAAIDVNVDGLGNDEVNINLLEGATLVYAYDGEEGCVIAGGYDAMHIGVGATSLGNWTCLNRTHGLYRVVGFELALGTWMQNAFGVDARVTLPIISLDICDTQTTVYPRSPELMDYIDRNKHRMRASGFLVTDASAYQGSDSTLRNDEMIISQLGSMSLHGRDHGTVGSEGENRDFATQVSDMAVAVDLLGSSFARYKPIKACPDNSWNVATLHAMYENGILYHSAHIGKSAEYESLYISVFDAADEFEREKILARGRGGSLRYYPMYHSDETGEVWIYSVDWHVALCAADHPGFVSTWLRHRGQGFWIPFLPACHFGMPSSCGATLNPDGWMDMIEATINTVDHNSHPWRRWVDTYDYAKNTERFDRDVTISNISTAGDVITYEIVANTSVRFMTLKVGRPGHVIESASIDGVEYNYFGEDYVHLPELDGDVTVCVSLGTGEFVRPHVTHISPSAVVENATNESGKLDLTLSGEFDVICRISGSNRVFDAGTTTVFLDVTEQLAIDASHNQRAIQLDLALLPAWGSVSANVVSWNALDTDYRSWDEWTETPGVRVEHFLDNLQPSALYRVMVDACPVDSCLSDNAGTICFTRVLGCSTSTYEVLLDSSYALAGPDVNDPGSMRILLESQPNPFGGVAVVSYCLPRATRAALKIYNLSGLLSARWWTDLGSPDTIR